MSSAAPGWYPDPMGSESTRYFDGQNWTEHLSSAPPVTSHGDPGGEPLVEPALDSASQKTDHATATASRVPIVLAGCAAAAVLVVAAGAFVVARGSDDGLERVSALTVSSPTASVSTAMEATTTTTVQDPTSTVPPPPAPATTMPPIAASPTVTELVEPPIQLDPGGLGPLRLEMSVQDASATGMIGPLSPGCDLGGPGELQGRLLPPFDGNVRFFDDKLFELSVDAVAPTPNGLRPGMLLDDLMTQIDGTGWYADVDASYDEMFDIWLGTLRDPQDGEYEFIVDPENQLVTSIHIPRVGFCE